MDNFTRWASCFLVAFFGLILFSPFAFAQVPPNGSVTYVGPFDDPVMAQAQCMVDYTRVRAGLATRGNSTCNPNSSGARCVWQPVDSLPGRACDVFYVSTVVGGQQRYFYGCRVRAHLVRLDDPSSISLQQSFSCTDEPANEFVWNGGSFTSTAMHGYYSTNNDGPDCTDKPSFDSRTLRAPTPNGSGDVCYQGCSYTVALGYVGTYPAGYLQYSFLSNNRQCLPDEEPPQDTTIDPPEPPDEPLDLDPDHGGVEKPVDPGPGRDSDGHGSSSGGGTCDAPPACTGDSIQCNILFQTWSTRCAVTNLGDDGGGQNGDNPWDGKTQEPGDTDVSQFISDEVIDGADFLDSSGMGLPRSCPQLDNYSLNVFGSVIEIDFMSRFCGATSWVGPFMVLLGSYLGILAFLRAK